MIDRSKLPNSFEFVVTAGARARQLLAGSTPRVDVKDHKKTTVAAQEVMTRPAAGAVTLDLPARSQFVVVAQFRVFTQPYPFLP